MGGRAWHRGAVCLLAAICALAAAAAIGALESAAREDELAMRTEQELAAWKALECRLVEEGRLPDEVRIANEGAVAAYVSLEVDVPVVDVVLDTPTGQLAMRGVDAVAFEPTGGWREAASSPAEGGRRRRVFAWSGALEPGRSTAALCDSVSLAAGMALAGDGCGIGMRMTYTVQAETAGASEA